MSVTCTCAVDETSPDCPIHGEHSVVPPEVKSAQAAQIMSPEEHAAMLGQLDELKGLAEQAAEATKDGSKLPQDDVDGMLNIACDLLAALTVIAVRDNHETFGVPISVDAVKGALAYAIAIQGDEEDDEKHKKTYNQVLPLALTKLGLKDAS